jgi:autotransporter passenger strand-loop-strand repeat protein/autotransporter-associated beta strand protein
MRAEAGGYALSGAELRQAAEVAAEAWKTSGGSRAAFAGALKRRLHVADGGKKLLAALSLFCLLQGATPLAFGATSEVGAGYPVSIVNGDVIGNGEVQNINSGGAANNGAIEYGGVQNVYNGGRTSGMTINWGEQNVYSGGTAFSGTIEYGGVQNVYNGGRTSGMTINWGTQNVNSGGIAIGGAINGGEQYVYSGGAAINGAINGGQQHVDNGAMVSGMTINSGGWQYIDSGGSAYVTTLYSGTQSVRDGGLADHTVVSDGGRLLVGSGGMIRNVFVHSGGELAFNSGGVGFAMTGVNIVKDGGMLSGAITLSDADTSLTLENDPYGNILGASFTGKGKLIKSGSGTVTLDTSYNSATNDYTGGTEVRGGLLIGDIPVGGDLTVSAGASYDGRDKDRSIGFLSGGGTVINRSDQTLTVGSGNFSGVVQGFATSGGTSGGMSGGDFIKSGTGSLTLGGIVEQGAMSLNGGTLSIGPSGRVNLTGGFTADQGVTLQLSAAGSAVISAATATISADNTTLEVFGDPAAGTSTPLIQTTRGITGDFGTYLVNGAAPSVPPTPSPERFINPKRLELVKTSHDIVLNSIGESLVWDDSSNAHGYFYVNGEELVDKTLADNTLPGAGTFFNWDGKTLTKTGAGKLTLAAKNEYTGDTIIESGILALSGDGTISNSLVLHKDTRFDSGAKDVLLQRLDVRGPSTYMGNLNVVGGEMRFALASDTTHGSTLLTVTQSAAINQSKVLIGIPGESPMLREGDAVNLIRAATLSGDPANDTANTQDAANLAAYTSAVGRQGALRHYTFNLSTTPTTLLATVPVTTPTPEPTPTPSTPEPTPTPLTQEPTPTPQTPTPEPPAPPAPTPPALAPAPTPPTPEPTPTPPTPPTPEPPAPPTPEPPTPEPPAPLVNPGKAAGTNDPRGKALLEGHLAGMALVNQGADLVAGAGMRQALQAVWATGAHNESGLAGFGRLAGGRLRHHTGSRIDMNSFSLLTGLAYGAELRLGRFTGGVFFEYGTGSYDTYNGFSNGVAIDGDGNAWYIGGGILARMDFLKLGPGRFHLEASGRAGKAHNEFESSDLRDYNGRKAEYDISTPYYGLHVGTGYIWDLSEALSFDTYGKYFWTHLEGDSARLESGDPVRFKDINSQRLRLGGRIAYVVNEYCSPYLGAAWEHEFEAKARGSAYGDPLDAPSLKGDTGIGELGLSLRAPLTVPVFFDLGVQGYTGKREGVTGSLQLRIEF